MIEKYCTLICFDVRSRSLILKSTNQTYLWMAFNRFKHPNYYTVALSLEGLTSLQVYKKSFENIYYVSMDLYQKLSKGILPFTELEDDSLELPLEDVVLKIHETEYKQKLEETPNYPKWAIALQEP